MCGECGLLVERGKASGRWTVSGWWQTVEGAVCSVAGGEQGEGLYIQYWYWKGGIRRVLVRIALRNNGNIG